MSAWNRKLDHGAFELKWLLRKKLIAMIEPETAIDLFAGEGRLLCSLYDDFPAVHAVEKNPKKWERLRNNVAGITPGRVKTYCQDNRTFMRTVLPGIPKVNLLDFDAYGNPHPAIRDCFKYYQPTQRAVIAITDGSRLALCRGQKINLASYQPDEIDPRSGGQARLNPLLFREYELFINTFWSRLARGRRFRIIDQVFAWKKARRVLYYGVCIEPDRDPMDRDPSPLSQSLEPEPDGPR